MLNKYRCKPHTPVHPAWCPYNDSVCLIPSSSPSPCAPCVVPLYTAHRPQQVHTGQGLKVGLHPHSISGGNFNLSWFYGRGAIKGPAHGGTSKGLSQAIDRGPIRKFLPKYANVYVTIQRWSQCRCTVPLFNC